MIDNQNTKKREPFWDFIKGIATLVVMFIHSQGGWDYISSDFYVPIDSFNFNSWFIVRTITVAVIPVFFFISGYMISTRNIPISEYYRKRSKRIVLPFLFWSGVYTLVSLFIYHNDVTFVSFLLGTNGIQLYFLFVMIQLMLLTPLLVHVKNRKLMLFFCLAVTLANDIYQLTYWIRFHEILSNEMILCTCFIFYYYLGYYFKTSVNVAKLNTREMRIVSLVMVIVSYGLLLISSYWLLNQTDNVPVAGSFNNPVNILYSLSVIICIMSYRNLYKSGFLASKLEWVGLMSIDFFAVHWLFMDPMKQWVHYNFPSKYLWLSNIVMIILTFACTYLLIKIKQKAIQLVHRQAGG